MFFLNFRPEDRKPLSSRRVWLQPLRQKTVQMILRERRKVYSWSCCFPEKFVACTWRKPKGTERDGKKETSRQFVTNVMAICDIL